MKLCCIAILWFALAAAASPAGAVDPKLTTPRQQDAPTAFAGDQPVPVAEWGEGAGRSFRVPAYEIPAFQLALNRFDHYVVDADVYRSPIANFKENTHHKWVVDNDAYGTNQFLHPYQGAFYQGVARSAGLGFWESSAYTVAGSVLWEMAGETTRPSINDQVASGIGGNFLGEPLFRMASLLLESNGGGGPSLLREVGAALLSPSLGLNRLVYGKRFDAVFRSNDPAVFTRVDAGASLSTHFSSNVNVNADPAAPPTNQGFKKQRASATFTMAYGLPGKPDYSYDRPFDYFNFEVDTDTSIGFDTLFSRGLLFGTDYAVAENYRGIWGLYGSYEYVAPQIFVSPPRHCRWGLPASGGCRATLLRRGPSWRGPGTAAGECFTARGSRRRALWATASAIIIMA